MAKFIIFLKIYRIKIKNNLFYFTNNIINILNIYYVKYIYYNHNMNLKNFHFLIKLFILIYHLIY